jgi:hypothetical protein
MSSYDIYFFLKVFIPTASAVSQPAILPSFKRDFLQVINFLQVLISPDSKAHYKDAKNASSPIFSVGIFPTSISYLLLTIEMF